MNMLGLRLALAALVVGTTLSGCTFFAPFTTCEGTDSAVAELDRLPVLNLRPPQASPAGDGKADGAACHEDSGDAWLSANRLYTYDGSRAELLEYYGREAPAAGWRPIQRLDTGPDGQISVFCFESREQPSITLAFESREHLRELYGIEPGPDPMGPGSRIWFSLSAEAASDGSRMGCFG
ncbi:hypothetical protein ACFWBN_17020 [Streptomyces sp. NPDC059989]|uniref:hypothetical protein n=1 Tax=Streptomyces sp. NPDC059989 TaxID=3347026 RepID=UPI003681F6F7